MHQKHSFPIVGIYMPHYLIHILKINQDKPSIIILHILISVAIGITLYGLKSEFELTMVNEPFVVKPLKKQR